MPDKVQVSGDDVTPAFLRGLEADQELEQLTIWGGHLTNGDLEPLSRLTRLKWLCLGEMPIDDGICLTATLDILKAIAHGSGPETAILALGYAGWGAGQLESEINDNGWLNCPADPALVFDESFETKYDRAMQKIGIDLSMLSSAAGHA